MVLVKMARFGIGPSTIADRGARIERLAIPDILARTKPGEEIRCWVSGCATGEEVYSPAILLHEQLERAGRPSTVKIFATDVHRASQALASAGTGLTISRTCRCSVAMMRLAACVPTAIPPRSSP